MTQALAVWWNNQQIGRLVITPQRMLAFSYDGDWLQSGRAISCSLPLEETGDFLPPDMRAHWFFANFLPEGNARDRLVRRLGVPDDDFLLLERLGGDCAGALSLWPEQGPAQLRDNGLRDDGMREISTADISRAIRQGGIASLLCNAEEGGHEDLPRLSLAGAQDKLPVRIEAAPDGPRLFMPLGNTASTHILKLPVNDLRHVPLYECYTTFMAQQLGLPVAECVPLELDGHLCSLSTRYDREQHEGHVRRLHQEDFCQASGRSRTAKYADQGASLAIVAEVLRRHSSRAAADLQQVIRWQVFNALCGNTDGHLKNLSLLEDGDGWKLAPFYDLVCVLAIESVSHRMALGIGGMFDSGSLMASHWQGLAAEMGVAWRQVASIISEMAGTLRDNHDQWHADFQSRYGEFAVLQRPHMIIRKQVTKATSIWTGN